ncbi:MAG: hypothetical protein Q9204_002785 [Flavoplaca sp. TL-2023a]
MDLTNIAIGQRAVPPPPYADVALEDGSPTGMSMASDEAVGQSYQRRNNPADDTFNLLVDLMYSKLPQELIDLVEDEVMEGLICPGYIFPWKHDGNVIWEGTMYQAAQPEYLLLSKRIYAKYKRRMQTENTYPIGIEDTEGTLRFPPAKDRLFIRKAHIRFDIADLDPDEGGYDFWNFGNEDRCSPQANCSWCQEDGCYKDGVWMKKTKYIECLELDELTIDLRGCCRTWSRDDLRLDGQTDHWMWDGIAVASCTRYFRFDLGVPAVLHVLARDKQEEQNMLQVIYDKDQPRATKISSISHPM